MNNKKRFGSLSKSLFYHIKTSKIPVIIINEIIILAEDKKPVIDSFAPNAMELIVERLAIGAKAMSTRTLRTNSGKGKTK